VLIFKGFFLVYVYAAGQDNSSAMVYKRVKFFVIIYAKVNFDDKIRK